MQKETAIPLAYFITFTSYGTWLHGGKETSVDRIHNIFKTEFLSLNLNRETSGKTRMKETPYLLDEARRQIVLNVVKEVCLFRAWVLIAAHIRTNHVHLIIHGKSSPENIMNIIKSYASRRLNESKLDSHRLKRWTRHGSTRYLWKEENVEATIRYVVYEQGDPMAVFENKSRSEFAGTVIAP